MQQTNVGQDIRELSETIVIPEIRGEMARLRPATLEDLAAMDAIDAYDNASTITGNNADAERAMVHAWVERSVAWSHVGLDKDITGNYSFNADAQSRPTTAWAIVPDRLDDGENTNGVIIGMIFLIDIDGWARSARIQVVLGSDYRGRGYSRDAMPRVMTYAFAATPIGLGLHRIWVGVPSQNVRALSVYQSLGFMKTGTSRDALWDEKQEKYQDFVVLDTLADEYDAIRSLDMFGLRIIEENPGVREALSAHEHSLAMPVSSKSDQHDQSVNTADEDNNVENVEDTDTNEFDKIYAAVQHLDRERNQTAVDNHDNDDNNDSDEAISWPYSAGSETPASSKRAWWRIIGRGRNRNTEGKR